MRRFTAIMITNVDKQHGKISSVFTETGGWTVKVNTYENQTFAHRSCHLYRESWTGGLKMNPTSWSEPRSNHCGPILCSMGPLIYRTLCSGRWPVLSRDYNCGLIVRRFTLLTCITAARWQLKPGSEWVTRLKPACLMLLTCSVIVLSIACLMAAFSSIIRTQVTKM